MNLMIVVLLEKKKVRKKTEPNETTTIWAIFRLASMFLVFFFSDAVSVDDVSKDHTHVPHHQ